MGRTFSQLMMQGKVQNALRYLSREATGNGNQPHMCTTHDILHDKHPPGASQVESFILRDAPNPVNSIVFDNLNTDTTHQAALHTYVVAGLSGLDAYAWRRLCSSFGSASHNLCSALAAVGRHICTTFLRPEGLSAFVACRLIPLDKCPGVRPIGVGEVPRRNVATDCGSRC